MLWVTWCSVHTLPDKERLETRLLESHGWHQKHQPGSQSPGSERSMVHPLEFFVRGNWIEWESWENPPKMFSPEVEIRLFWSVPGVQGSMEAIGDQVDKVRCWVGRGGHQWPSRQLLSVISLLCSHSHHQKPWGEGLCNVMLGSPTHQWLKLTPVTTTLSTPISQPWRGASRFCYLQLPGTSQLTSQSPSWHQGHTPQSIITEGTDMSSFSFEGDIVLPQ